MPPSSIWSDGRATSSLPRRRSISSIQTIAQRAIENWLETLAAPGRDTRWRGRHRCADGRYLWIEFTNCNLLDDLQYDGVRSEMLDISDEMAMHDELRKSEERFRRLAEALPLGLAQIDGDRQITYANQPFTDIAAAGSTTVDAAFETTIESDRQSLEDAIRGALEYGRDATIEFSLGRPSDTPRCIQLVLRPLHGESSGTAGAILVAADVTERTSMRLELERRASFDALTSCYNRSTTLAILEDHLASDRPAEVGTAAIFVDLDRFKPVNDNFGHAAGDEVLAVVAQRMRSAIRDNDVIGRIGGDEFLVICPNIADVARATEIAERIATSLQHEFVIPGSRVSMSASIGIAWADADDNDADSLVRARRRGDVQGEAGSDGPAGGRRVVARRRLGRTFSELDEPLLDPGHERVRGDERRAIGFGSGQHLLGGRAGFEAHVEVDQGRRARPGTTRDEGRSRQLVEGGDLPAGEIHVHHDRRIGHDVRGSIDGRFDVGVRHAAVHRRECLAAQVQP